MYDIATLILEYEKMVKAITLRELTPKVLCQVLYKHFNFVPFKMLTLFYKQNDNSKKAQVTCPK